MTDKRTGAPHEPAPYDNRIIYAIRALKAGTASEAQQQIAWDWIVYYASGYNELSYRPDEAGGERATIFMEGRRFVGAQMLKMLQANLTPAPEPAKKRRTKR